MNVINGVWFSNLLEVSFFVEEVKSITIELDSISFSHVKQSHNFLAHSFARKAFEEHTFFILLSPYSLSGLFHVCLVM